MVCLGPFKQFQELRQVDQVDQDFWQLKFQLGIGPDAAQTNHDPQTENNFLFFIFINNAQATSDRVQAKRGTLINFFYS